jgi:hypothetical protein
MAHVNEVSVRDWAGFEGEAGRSFSRRPERRRPLSLIVMRITLATTTVVDWPAEIRVGCSEGSRQSREAQCLV